MTYNGKRKESWRNIRRNHEGLLRDSTASVRADAFGMLIKYPTKKDGSFDGDAPDIVDVENAVEFLTFARKKDFNEDDIETLLGYLESALYVFNYKSKKAGGDKEAEAREKYLFFEPFASSFGEILFDKRPTTEAENEGVITLGEAIIDALRGIKDEDFKARAILSTLSTMRMFQDLRGTFTPDLKKITMAEVEDGFESEEKLRRKFESLFENRKTLRSATVSDRLYRKFLISAYIDERVFDRFFSEAGEERYTPARAKEWDTRFNELCDEYGETGYKRNFSDEHYQDYEPSKYCPELCYYSTHLNGEDFNAYDQEETRLLAEHLGLGEDILKRAEELQTTYGRTKEEIEALLKQDCKDGETIDDLLDREVEELEEGEKDNA